MKNIIKYSLALLMAFSFLQTSFAAKKTDPLITNLEPCSSTFNAEPPFLSVSALPSTTLLVDFSGSLNEHAYQEKEVKWDTGTVNATAYTGFDSAKEYYGYFDQYTYYEYSSGKFTNATSASDTTWNGNFLNWATMHRIDVLKKAMTGGSYNSATGYYTVSKTDALENRGKYHVYNATNKVIDLKNNLNFVVPSTYRKLIGLEQGSLTSSLIVYEMSQTSSAPPTFTNNTTASTGDTFSLNISTEQQFGILHYIGPNTRLALFTFANDDTHDDGGKILHQMTGNATEIIDLINKQDPSSSNTDSPLAEALYTITGYIQQKPSSTEGPRYNDDTSYPISETTDPFYFPNATDPTKKGKLLSCTQQNVIIISDGISTYDKNIPELITQHDIANNNDNCNLPDEGTCYLDDVAYWAHTTDLRDDIDGNNTVNIYAISLFSKNSTLLENAAKWGGFQDFQNDGVNDKIDWDADNNNIPDNFFEASSGAELEQGLAISMTGLINRASSGGSASVVSTSRRGEGLLYQAVFWPELIDENGDRISWAGDVFTYWLDDNGILYEDDGLNSEHTLASDDHKISIWYDSSDPSYKRSRACSGGTVINGECVNGTVKELTSVKHVWRASEWLNKLSNTTITKQRDAYLDNTDKRYIKTWVDIDNNGMIDKDEYIDFVDSKSDLTNLVDTATINWIRGQDQSDLRSRNIYIDNKPVTWRLGDVINSSPTIVGAPSENFHLYWNSTSEGQSYANFLAKYQNRRLMVYFGGNDGMLHAINGGFYSEKDHTYYNAKQNDGTLYPDSASLPIGAEMWAYVPYNLLPHLKCLTNINYQHKYYVDLKPRVFDARVFPTDVDDGVHIDGWGTILVCGFNFGGSGFPNRLPGIDENPDRYFGSSYFIFDVTNPESPPTLLGEMTFDETLPFGFSINAPTLVASKDDTNFYWYLLFGNGPNFMSGETKISPKGLVIPLKDFISDRFATSKTVAFRPTANLGDPSETKMGIIDFGKTIGTGNLKACISTGFVSIDYDFDFFVDMLYYGLVTTEGSELSDRNGGLHRLKLDKKIDPKQVMKMLETDQPVTAAPNAAVKDVYGKTGSIWVYSGTGLFWDKSHKDFPGDQWIFGVEEKRKDQSYDFATRNWDKLHDVTNIKVLPDGEGTLECNGSCDIPSGISTVEELGNYIQNTQSVEGWKRKLDKNERILGQPTLFGGLTNYTTFTPSDDLCTAEGNSKLYALYYRTGTAWKENVFGGESGQYVPDVVDLGQGMGVTPSLHLGSEEGVRVYIQTSTGAIIEIHQPNLPIPGVKSGTGGWHTLEVDP